MHLIVITVVFYSVSLTDNHLKYLSKSDIKKLLKCNVFRVLGPPRLAPYQADPAKVDEANDAGVVEASVTDKAHVTDEAVAVKIVTMLLP